MARPLFPTVGATPDEQRVRQGLNEFVTQILDAGVFQTRLIVGRPLVSSRPGGLPLPVSWGALNRVALLASGIHTVGFPRVRSEQIGMPLVLSLRCATGAVARIVAPPPALVNQSPTGLLVASGITVQAVTDGTDWTVF